VKVLAVDQIASTEEEVPRPAKAVTLEVTLEQAKSVALAAQIGTLTLSLRPDNGQDEAPGSTITIDDLEPPIVPHTEREARPADKAAPPAKPSHGNVTVTRGLKPSVEKVPFELPF
jgi:pilus assembly protein CpaB